MFFVFMFLVVVVVVVVVISVTKLPNGFGNRVVLCCFIKKENLFDFLLTVF